MSIKKKLLHDVITNRSKNVSFRDFQVLLEAFGYRLDRVNGSHRIYEHKEVPQRMNVQDENGKAKAYQVSRFLRIVEKYNLKLEGE